MNNKKIIILPCYKEALEIVGENIKLARLRRNLKSIQVSERAGIARSTLYLIEKGDASVSLGAYFNVLRVLGLQNDFLKLAADDEFGRKLQDLELLNKKDKISLLETEARKIYYRIYLGIKKKKYSKNLEEIVGLNCGDLIEYLNDNEFGFKVDDLFIDIDHIIPIKNINKLKNIESINHFSNLQLLPSEYNRNIKKDKLWDIVDFKKWLDSI